MSGRLNLLLALLATGACGSSEMRPLTHGERLLPAYARDPVSDTIADSVRARYMVDPRGIPQPWSVVVDGTSRRAANAVRDAVEEQRAVTPPVAGASRITHREELFVFLPPDQARQTDSLTAAWGITPAGHPRVILGQVGKGKDDTVILPAADLIAAYRAILVRLAANGNFPGSVGGARPTLCVSMSSAHHIRDPDEETRGLLMERGFTAVSDRECPRMYSAAFRRVDSVGRLEEPPPGWVNPLHVNLAVRLWSTVAVKVVVTLTGAERVYQVPCDAQRTATGWQAACERPLRVIT